MLIAERSVSFLELVLCIHEIECVMSVNGEEGSLGSGN